MPNTIQSKRTFQIQCLPWNTTASEFENEIANLVRNANPRRAEEWRFKIGFAASNVAGEKFNVGTVSCPSEKIKGEMMKQAKLKSNAAGSRWKGVIVDDSFLSLTILYSSPDFPYPTAE